MRNIAIAQNALDQIRQLDHSHRVRAAQAVDELRQSDNLAVWMLPQQTDHQLYAAKMGDLVLIFRELPAGTTLILSLIVYEKRNGKRK
jgi:hypothetical protein